MTDAKPERDVMAFAVAWEDFQREPTCPPNPDYPEGIDVDAAKGKTPCCRVDLAYPAPRCGAWMVKCLLCGLTAMVTTAGRPDDPRSLTVACKTKVK